MKNFTSPVVRFLLVLVITLSLTSCGGAKQKSQANNFGIKLPFTKTVRVVGAGSTFPAPLYENWFALLFQKFPQLQFDYQSIGSEVDLERFDFGASEIDITDEQITNKKRGVLFLPMTAGSIVLTYNLPEVPDLKLTRDAYINIFLGNITNWNDPKISQSNPGVTLPNRPITVVYPLEQSSTTAIFTKYLSAISPEWKKTMGSGTVVEWPLTKETFLGGKGNEGVAALVEETQGSIAFVEYGFAANNKLKMAALENKAGKFVAPTNESGTITLAQIELSENLREFITDPSGDESYPIVTYSWMLVYKTGYDDPNKAIAMEAMIQFGLTEGQKKAAQQGYIELPSNVRERVAMVANEITPDFDIKLSQ